MVYFYHHRALISTSQLVVATTALKHLFFILWIIFSASQIGTKSIIFVSLEFSTVFDTIEHNILNYLSKGRQMYSYANGIQV